jgi:hypothetical protein
MDKLCASCGESKPLHDFYKDSRASDGAASSCKVCILAKRAAKVASRTPEQVVSDRATRREYSKQWRATDKGKVWAQEYAKANPPHAKDKARRNARAAVARAVRRGLQLPTVCESCETMTKLQAHHHNGYDKAHQLDVVWLCVSCHGKEHRI